MSTYYSYRAERAKVALTSKLCFHQSVLEPIMSLRSETVWLDCGEVIKANYLTCSFHDKAYRHASNATAAPSYISGADLSHGRDSSNYWFSGRGTAQKYYFRYPWYREEISDIVDCQMARFEPSSLTTSCWVQSTLSSHQLGRESIDCTQIHVMYDDGFEPAA